MPCIRPLNRPRGIGSPEPLLLAFAGRSLKRTEAQRWSPLCVSYNERSAGTRGKGVDGIHCGGSGASGGFSASLPYMYMAALGIGPASVPDSQNAALYLRPSSVSQHSYMCTAWGV